MEFASKLDQLLSLLSLLPLNIIHQGAYNTAGVSVYQSQIEGKQILLKLGVEALDDVHADLIAELVFH